MLTLMMAVVAGLGVLNTVLLGTRDRVHDLGVFKAVGMTPRQTIAMVLCWVVAPAVVAAVIAIPVGMVLHSATADAMARAAYTGAPCQFPSCVPAGRDRTARTLRAHYRRCRRNAASELGCPLADRDSAAGGVAARAHALWTWRPVCTPSLHQEPSLPG